jgi:hypothetical protein
MASPACSWDWKNVQSFEAFAKLASIFIHNSNQHAKSFFSAF